MADKKHILTYAGLKKYEDELQDLKVNRRREIAQKIKEAREQGDLSENAEYDAAKDEQRDIELRIEELEKLLKNAEVVVEDEVNLDKINVGRFTMSISTRRWNSSSLVPQRQTALRIRSPTSPRSDTR